MIIKDGKSYARVSDILKPFSNFSHIKPDVLENKCRIGTAVHKAIEADLNGKFPALEEDTWGYFRSYLCWFEHLNATVEQTEVRYFSDKYMITGQIDALMHFKGDHLPTLIDFKTSASEGDTWPMQAYLYALLLSENGVPIEQRFLFVKLDKMDQLPKVFEYKFDRNIAAKCLKAIEDFWKSEKSDSNLFED